METMKYENAGYVLTMRATDKRDNNGHILVSYKLIAPDGETIFKGADFGASPMHDPTGNESAGALLSFLTLRDGDTDPEWFDSYTPRQLDFRDNEAEELQDWAEMLETRIDSDGRAWDYAERGLTPEQ